MRRFRLLICVMLAFLLATGALAADPAAMTDISGHWAEDSIGFCMNAGLFEGVSETSFAPESTMTRGMFITVLGRMAGVNPGDFQPWYQDLVYADVPAGSYYAPYVIWATRYGIVNGVGGGAFAPDRPITREQIAAMLIRYASVLNYQIVTASDTIADSFTDADYISDYAREPVESLRQTGILNGYDNGDGTHRFAPQKTATRAECAAIFQRIQGALQDYEGRTPIEPQDLTISPESLELHPGDQAQLAAAFYPEDTTNQTVTWVSTDPGIVTVDLSGTVTALAEGTAEIHGYTWNGLSHYCTIRVTKNVSLAYEGESYTDKCIRIFGETVEDYRTFYDIDDTSYLVEVPVRVWSFTDSSHTEKYTRTITLQVHANLADTVQAIFEEIYNGDEQFPIYSAGGYYRSSYSEHTPGLAIDINPEENYECLNDGTALTGSHWTPGEDPYSIPPDGDVVRAFRKYGFGWGGSWNSKKDYMHFSYFGT